MKNRIAASLCLIILTAFSVGAQRQTPAADPRIDYTLAIDPTNPVTNGAFGSALAFGDRLDGWPLFIGQPSIDGVGSIERAYFTGSTWISDSCVVSPSDPQTEASFGAALATSGTGASARLIVGAPNYDVTLVRDDYPNNGTVEIFDAGPGGCPERIASLDSPAVSANANFGYSVDIAVGAAEMIAVVGAPSDATSGGAAYVYTSINGGVDWSLQATLTGNPAASGAKFGWDVAISGIDSTPTIIVGAPGEATGAGAAYVFRRSGTSWPQEDKLADSPVGYGTAVDVAVGTSNTFVAVGCQSCGGLYVFKRIPAPDYMLDHFVSSAFLIGRDVDLKFHPDGTTLSMTFSTSSNYIPSLTRLSQFNWPETDTFFTGAVISKVALAVGAGAPFTAGGHTTKDQDALVDAGQVLLSSPSSTAFDLLDGGDFRLPIKTTGGALWKQVGKSGDKRVCDVTDGCYFQFKGGANENSSLTQTVRLTNHTFQSGDIFMLSARVKTTGSKPVVRLKIKIKYVGGQASSSSLFKAQAADWKTIVAVGATLNCVVPTQIVATVTNLSKSGKIKIDDVMLTGASSNPIGCAPRQAPLLPVPVAP